MDMYMVGGAVRDTLLGRESKDTDFVIVGSTPEKMLEMGFKQVGADFPVFLDEHGTEYALARTERKTGRGYAGFETDHGPSVTLEADLMRRDLTINAMATPAFSSSFDVIDPFGGQEDLKNKVLRHVSPAFADDPVRVLRLARFHARYGPEWTVHPDTLAFCRKMVEDGELDFLTRERVVAELLKALAEPHPSLFFDTLHTCGALEVVLPEFYPEFLGKISWYNAFSHIPSTMFSYFVLSMMVNAHGMEERLVIPSDFVKYAKMARTMYQGWSSVDAIYVLYRMDAYRQRDLFERISHDLKQGGHITESAQRLMDAFELTKDVKLADLPDSERLKKVGGPIIATAIRNERERIYRATWCS